MGREPGECLAGVLLKKVSRMQEPGASGVKSHRATKYNADRRANIEYGNTEIYLK